MPSGASKYAQKCSPTKVCSIQNSIICLIDGHCKRPPLQMRRGSSEKREGLQQQHPRSILFISMLSGDCGCDMFYDGSESPTSWLVLKRSSSELLDTCGSYSICIQLNASSPKPIQNSSRQLIIQPVSHHYGIVVIANTCE